MNTATLPITAIAGPIFSLVSVVPPHLNDSVTEAANSLEAVSKPA